MQRSLRRFAAPLTVVAALAMAAPASAQFAGAPDNPCGAFQATNGCHGPEWNPGFGEPGYGDPANPPQTEPAQGGLFEDLLNLFG